MTSKIFIDTNIIIYAADKHEPVKRKTCRDLLKKLVSSEEAGVISTQVLQEFFVTATRKLGIESLLAKEMIHSFRNFEVVIIVPTLIEEAVDISILNKISFWDSLIIAAAESARCSTLLSEDLNHNQIIRGVTITNPFVSQGQN